MASWIVLVIVPNSVRQKDACEDGFHDPGLETMLIAFASCCLSKLVTRSYLHVRATRT
jgi:hypothetical protein